MIDNKDQLINEPIEYLLDDDTLFDSLDSLEELESLEEFKSIEYRLSSDDM